MNFLKKTTPWVAASVLAVASLFGQDKDKCTDNKMMNCKDKKDKAVQSFEQGQDILKVQVTPSYTAPATIQVRGAWDLFVTGTFIYWQPTQDNMEYGVTNSLYAGNLVGSTSGGTGGSSGIWLQQSFSFQPGFKVGIGMNTEHDDWDLFAEYTWLRDTTTSTSSAPAGGSIIPTRTEAFNPTTGALSSNVYSSASQTWTCNLDFLNLDMGRSCYVGRALTLRPAFGVRGTLIRQKLSNTYVNNGITASLAIPGTATSLSTAHSWSVGPRAALNGNWLLGSRFRVYGNVAGDVTFTQYNLKAASNFQSTATGTNTPLKSNEKNLGVVREHVEMELGFGWGSYFDNDNWYFDLTAGYTWQIFFDQNMFRQYGGLSNSGNLYINGLTLNVRFDF